ncbi:DUF1961 family protein [Asticcacaulis sp. DXS10W]|uniref:DUF1961 family protein n=1 Tax=Asticcacaulis currens TaxID=2984210 RepID=A0ABT5I973_9CAUL|nr:DUF1961 family protein [Asticcacaulis currens]MDC7692739.1 DUF1961 family protein [Asticcacaulis currens]
MTLSRRQWLATSLSACALPSGLFATEAEEVIYQNPLRSEADVARFKMEGDAKVAFPNNRMQLSALRDASEGQASNFVYWCPEVFPDHVEISWNFWPLREPGLCILFFAAQGLNGEHVLSPTLKPRAGIYDQYTKSDIEALQISYFRRRWEEERAFHLANLRYAPGFELLAQGADPLPDVEDARPPYRIRIRKSAASVAFTINDLPVVSWTGASKRKWPGKGSVGFRQMAPLIAEYADLEVRRLAPLR